MNLTEIERAVSAYGPDWASQRCLTFAPDKNLIYAWVSCPHGRKAEGTYTVAGGRFPTVNDGITALRSVVAKECADRCEKQEA